jgi:hypothetical protein
MLRRMMRDQINWLTQHMHRSNLAILVQPFWKFLPSTNNLVNYASEQEIALCNLNPTVPGDCILHPECNVGAQWFNL